MPNSTIQPGRQAEVTAAMPSEKLQAAARQKPAEVGIRGQSKASTLLKTQNFTSRAHWIPTEP
ncbi:MAG: hypothetical protein ACI8P0_006316 [Planctomycetaceae bacterium]|jgi:hypothetical protein